MEEIDSTTYIQVFDTSEKRCAALKQALDIRKFEIELYWKRATYFWAFIAAAFAGFFALQKSAADTDGMLTLIVACLGFEFSLGWYLVNRGSKAWQENWERHVDLLENDIMGPLYKTVLSSEPHRFWNASGPYPYSPSKLNQILSLFVTVIWTCLVGSCVYPVFADGFNGRWLMLLLMAITALFAGALVCGGQTHFEGGESPTYIRRRNIR